VEVVRQGVRMSVPFEHPEHIQQPMIERVTAFFKGEGENPCPAQEAVEVMRVMEGWAI
jgi:hypothetical protein